MLTNVVFPDAFKVKDRPLRVADIRRILVSDYMERPFQPMIELYGASFLADEPSIIGAPDPGYIARELKWYESQSLSIHDMPGGAPMMWRRAADEGGTVNSNYGWVLWSEENGSQFGNVVRELRRDYASRRALAIYTRPSMHVDQKLGGSGQDFMCTNAVGYSIDADLEVLDACVQMRSNDVVFGYRNDYAWQEHALEAVLEELQKTYPSLRRGRIIWQAMSLHVYPRHYSLLRVEAQKAIQPDGLKLASEVKGELYVRDGDVA